MKSTMNTPLDVNYQRVPPANHAKAGRGRIASADMLIPSARQRRRMMKAQARRAAKRQAKVTT